MSRRSQLPAILLGLLLTGPTALARDVTFFAAAAPHYGYNENLDKLNIPHIQAMNGLPGWEYPDGLGIVDTPRGVIICGDLTQQGFQEEWEKFVNDYGLTGT